MISPSQAAHNAQIETFVTVQKWSITPDGVTGIFSDYYGQTVYTVWDQDAFKYCLPLMYVSALSSGGIPLTFS